MQIGYDPAKRLRTLAERGLDFEDAARVFEGRTYTIPDDRLDYGEARFLTFGFLDERVVVLVWTSRVDGRRIISMRHANDRERQRVRRHLD
jgi:uncharacterized DUF497 family protein